MVQSEAKLAWRLFTLNWIPNGVLGLALALGLLLTEFSLKTESLLIPLGLIALFAGVAYGYALTRRLDSRVPFVFGSIAQLGLMLLLVRPAIYIAAAVDLPMQDANLAYLDGILGLDWQAYFHFIYDRPTLVAYVVFLYAMIGWPVFGIPVVLGSSRHYCRLQQFTLAWMLALIATTIISTLLPAIGTYHQYGIQLDLSRFDPSNYLIQEHDLPLLRAGALRALDSETLGGIITFPSFHAATAVLYLWALWSVWWMRPLALIANVGMLVATPMGGGHYFVDVFAGIGVAVLAIAAARWVGQWLLAGGRSSTTAMVMPGAAMPAE